MACFGNEIAEGFSRFSGAPGHAPCSRTSGPGHGHTQLDAALGHGATRMLHRIAELGIAETFHHRCQSHQPRTHTKRQNCFQFKHEPIAINVAHPKVCC